MEKRFKSVKSQLLIGFIWSVLRPVLARAPSPATMYCALGLLARYPTMYGLGSKSGLGSPLQRFPEGKLLLHRAVTPLPVPATPPALKMARSPALSPFKLESTPLWTVPNPPVSYMNTGANS